ncbi:MAG: hypothetical protein ACJAXU_000824, partial [Paracoccaceae bacterium]
SQIDQINRRLIAGLIHGILKKAIPSPGLGVARPCRIGDQMGAPSTPSLEGHSFY